MIDDKWNQLKTDEISEYFSLFVCLFYLRSCSAVVGPLVPGCPSSCFPPLPQTVPRPFLLSTLLSFYPLFSSSCRVCRGKWSRVKTETAAEAAAVAATLSPSCFVVANIHHHKHNNSGQVHPNTDNFKSPKRPPGLVKHFGSVLGSCGAVKQRKIRCCLKTIVVVVLGFG